MPASSSSAATRPASPSHQQLALAAGVAVAAVWGANFAVQKTLFGLLPPGAFLFARYLLMPLCAALLLLHANGWRWLRLPRADAIKLAGLGVLAHTGHVSMVTYGIHWSTAFSSALIMACGPVFTLLILHWAGLERLTRGQVAGVAPVLVTADVSFISLTQALPVALELAAPGAQLVALIKPQFEAGRAAIGKGGIVRTAEDRDAAVARVREWIAIQPGWRVLDVIPSPLEGKSGNTEFLLAAIKTGALADVR